MKSSITIAIGSSDRLLTVSEVAARLGLATVTIRAWAARRRIASTKLGRALRIPESEVQRIVNAGYSPALSAGNKH